MPPLLRPASWIPVFVSNTIVCRFVSPRVMNKRSPSGEIARSEQLDPAG